MVTAFRVMFRLRYVLCLCVVFYLLLLLMLLLWSSLLLLMPGPGELVIERMITMFGCRNFSWRRMFVALKGRVGIMIAARVQQYLVEVLLWHSRPDLDFVVKLEAILRYNVRWLASE